MIRIKMQEDIKLASEQAQYKKHCNHCGHTISFYAFEKEKKLCSWCGRFNYKDAKAKFKDILMNIRRKQNASNKRR